VVAEARRRAERRRRIFGDEPVASADERDPDAAQGADADRRFHDERPPHHDRP
jgi:hypothetical protein